MFNLEKDDKVIITGAAPNTGEKRIKNFIKIDEV